jgi:putative (di)nucleoside polyphosphate hydrolase
MKSGLYRPCVGIILINPHHQVFIGERIDHPGAWQMPQGGMEPGEDLETAFFRELMEETGTNAAKILAAYPEPIRYDFPSTKRSKLYQGQYDGQEQTWVAAHYLGDNSDIKIDQHTPQEFRAWRWCTPLELLDIIVPFKRPTYERVLGYFKKYLLPGFSGE